MVTYTVAICNYNEADSLEPSLRSVLNQIDDRFEVLVVDDGSTDGSLSILKRFEQEYDRFRVIPLPRDRSRKLGRTRTISIEEAKGEHVLLHVDTDNYYTECFEDFVAIYEQFDKQLEFDFYLLATSFAIAKRDFLLKFGAYRNLPVGGEDRDLWRRLAAADRLVCLEHEPVERIEGWDYGSTHRDTLGQMRRTIEVKTADFQVGISVRSYVRWALDKPPHLVPYHLFTIVASYLLALPRESYETPEAFRQKGQIDVELQRRMKSLSELEAQYDVEIDRNVLSDRGVELFDQ